jgi:uncharacterized protein (DUF2252 family)
MMKKMMALFSASLVMGAAFTSCRSRTQALAPPSSALNAGVSAQRFQSFGSSRDLFQLLDKYHAPLLQRNPGLIQLKYDAMKSSAFAFYRATAFIFYHDMASQKSLNQAVSVPLQGDFHLENLGTYRTAAGDFAYDLNDFDEAVSGPFTWDLARLGVSIYLAADEVGLKKSEQDEMARYFLNAYQDALAAIQRSPGLLSVPLSERYLSEKPAEQVTQARQRFSRSAWLQEMAPGGRFALGNKVQPVPAAELQTLQQAVQRYAAARREGPAFFNLKDAAVRIAGKGSLGRYRYIVLMEGATAAPQDDLILEFKEATTPSANYAGQRSSGDDGQRIVNAYRQMLPQADPYLGVSRFGALSAYVRELLPDESVNLEKVNKVSEYRDFLDSVALIIARAHSRTGQAARIQAEVAQQESALLDFMKAYTAQVESDYNSFRKN